MLNEKCMEDTVCNLARIKRAKEQIIHTRRKLVHEIERRKEKRCTGAKKPIVTLLVSLQQR